MDDADLLRWRLASHRLTGPGFAPAPDAGAAVVRWLAAVQSQDHEPALWSLARRACDLGRRDLAAAFEAGGFLRTHVLRPTWHYVPPEELRPLLALTGPRVAAGCAARWRELELPAPLRVRATDVMAGAIAERGPLTRAELQLVLEAAGISTVGQRLPHLLMYAELEAVLCSGGVRGRQHTWALVDDRTPAARPFDREETLRSTTLQFVRSHAPVTERDLAWWSGLALRDVRHGLELARPAAAVLEVGGRRFWYVEEPPPPRSGGPAVHLVQSYDEFLVGYSDSRDLVDPAGFAKHMPRAALLGPSLLVDGTLAGRWRRTLGPAHVEIEVTPFRSLESPVRAALEEEARRFAAFVAAPFRLSVRDP